VYLVGISKLKLVEVLGSNLKTICKILAWVMVWSLVSKLAAETGLVSVEVGKKKLISS